MFFSRRNGKSGCPVQNPRRQRRVYSSNVPTTYVRKEVASVPNELPRFLRRFEARRTIITSSRYNPSRRPQFVYEVSLLAPSEYDTILIYHTRQLTDFSLGPTLLGASGSIT